jgi:hypothetical protein
MTFRSSTRANILALLVFTTACANDSPMSPGSMLAFGAWGGDAAQVVTSTTTTHVLLGCTFGDFPGNITLDANGRFAVNGSWNPSVGPIQQNATMPAQMSGQVVGATLTFAIAVNDTIRKQVTSLGPQSAEFGKQASVVVCPL